MQQRTYVLLSLQTAMLISSCPLVVKNKHALVKNSQDKYQNKSGQCRENQLVRVLHAGQHTHVHINDQIRSSMACGNSPQHG